MDIQQIQKTLFRLYLHPGYRLAHSLDSDSFVNALGLAGEEAAFVRSISPEEIGEFADALHRKRRSVLGWGAPTAYRWTEENAPSVITDFLEINHLGGTEAKEEIANRFASFLRECSFFYEDFPGAVAEVARFEAILQVVTGEEPGHEEAAAAACADATAGDHHARSLYWKPASTVAQEFTVDALSIFLKKTDMSAPPSATRIVIAPGASAGAPPTVLRLSPPAYAVVRLLANPMSARRLSDRCAQENVGITPSELQSVLADLTRRRVLAHHCGD